MSKLICPHCQQEQEDEVEAYCVPSRVGPTSRAVDQCYVCDKSFAVEKNADGTYTVSKVQQ
jgi:hypothetical protein